MFKSGKVGNLLVALAVMIGIVGLTADADGQTRKKKKAASTPKVTSTTTTTISAEPQVVSRADDFSENTTVTTEPTPVPEITPSSASASVADLEARIRSLESSNSKDADAKQKRLLLNLDILTRAEQRSDAIRRQVIEYLEKESDIRLKMDRIEYELRPESIEKSVAFAGTLRPEELRAARKKSLESEKSSLQAMITEIQRTRSNLEATLQRSDAIVEKLRTKLEKEIDTALDEDPSKPEQ